MSKRNDLRIEKSIALKFNSLIDEFINNAKFSPDADTWTEDTVKTINKQKEAWSRIRFIYNSDNANLKRLYIDTVNTFLTQFILESRYGCKAENAVILQCLRDNLSPVEAAIKIVSNKQFNLM